jgi:hypothetical protein
MSSSTPNFDFWRSVNTLEVWEAAVLMNGFEPSALGDVMVEDPEEGPRGCGRPLEYDPQVRLILDAAHVNKILRSDYDTKNELSTKSIITMDSFVCWLKETKRSGLARQLRPQRKRPRTTTPTPPVETSADEPPKLRSTARELAILAALEHLNHLLLVPMQN